METTKYKMWIMAALIISVADVLAESLAIDGTPPDGMGPARQFIGSIALVLYLLLYFPLGLPKVYLLTVIGHCFNTALIGVKSGVRTPLFSFLGDLAVFFIYFMIVRAVLLFWERKRVHA